MFNVLATEAAAKQFNLRYSCAKDRYERFVDGPSTSIIETMAKWDSCTYAWTNMYRKVERDWKMAYLSRSEGTNSAEIEWKFDFTNDKLVISDITMDFETKLYEDGEVIIQFISGGQC